MFSKTCKLDKSLYGLKQARERFSNYLIGTGFQRTYDDSSVFNRFYRGSITILLLYVDDLMITGNDNRYITLLI